MFRKREAKFLLTNFFQLLHASDGMSVFYNTHKLSLLNLEFFISNFQCHCYPPFSNFQTTPMNHIIAKISKNPSKTSLFQ